MSDNLIILADRIKEISWTIGTSDFELSGAANGFSSFDSIYSDGDLLFYAATNGIKYEIGSGVFSVGQTTNSIVRMPFRSSDNDQKINFTDGAKEIYVTYPATHSVYIGSGVADLNFPQASGIAFWSSSNILNYDHDVIWDINNKRLGIKKPNPQYSIDVGGNGVESAISASGFYVGSNGVVFPAQNNGDANYLGGNQLVHFEPNELDITSGTDSILSLSGNVNQIIIFNKQPEGTFLAGPATNSCQGPCLDEYPIFRSIEVADIPDLSALYASFSDLESVSGILSSDLSDASGILRNDFSAGDAAQYNALIAASGALYTDIQNLTPIFNVTIDENNNTYVFSGMGTSGDENPTLRLHKGVKYIFNIDAQGSILNYPLYIKTEPSIDINNLFNDGVSNNGEYFGTLVFHVPQDAPDVLYYASSQNSNMYGKIYTADIDITSFNSYTFITGNDTSSDDSLVIWDASASEYKNVTLDNLLFAPSGNTYLKRESILSSDATGDLGEVTFDDAWAYFKTTTGWKRVRIQSFQTTTTSTTSTTWPPNCTLPPDCPANQFRTIVGVVQGGEFDGCPIYSDCATTTTTTVAPPITTTLSPTPISNYVYTWGYNGNNQLGFRTTELFSQTPTRVEISNVSQISASDYHVLAIDLDGHLYAWGWNIQGQLGNGTKVDAPTPILINDTHLWISVAAGDYHSAAINANGELFTWGFNVNGQLGNGTQIGHLIPTKVGSANNWVKVFCGTSHTLAINSIGELFAWGSNEYGQVGNGTFEDVKSPTKVGSGYTWTDVSAYMHTLAINTNGDLFAWGRNTEGQLGSLKTKTVTNDQGVESVVIDDVLNNVNLPVPVSKTSILLPTVASLNVNAGLNDNWLAIAAGYQHSLAINQAGELYVAGQNSYGAMGIGNNAGVSAFYKQSQERNWLKVAAGNYHSIIINAAGDLYACGRNNFGQLGNNTTEDLNVVTLISTDYDWDVPAAGYDFTASIGNIKMSITTTTTIEPLVFTKSLTLDNSGAASNSGDNISITGGQSGDIVEYNVPANKGSLPITGLVYANNVFIVAITATNGYDGSTFRLTRSGTEYVFDLTSGRIDI